MKDKTTKPFGRDWTNGEINFPKYLTPEIIHTALFIHNAKAKKRCAQE